MKKLGILAVTFALLSSSAQLMAQNRPGYAANRGASMGSGTTALWVGAVAVVAAGLGAWGISSMNSNNAH